MANSYKVSGNTVIDSSENLWLDKVFYNQLAFGRSFGGINYGYASSGETGSFPYSNVIDRFPFSATTVNAVDVGDLTVGRTDTSGQSSTSHGYTSGGTTSPPLATSNVIDRFPFSAATTNATDVGDLTVSRLTNSGGQSSSTHGYVSGGSFVPVITYSDVIDRFPFADATVNATDVGDLSVIRGVTSGQSSSTHGYTSGGITTPSPTPLLNTIDRFPFADALVNATDVGDLSVARPGSSGTSSETHGYASGGFTPAMSNVIDRFPFADALVNATDVGDLTVARQRTAGQTSSTHGYASGGATPTVQNIIDRFPFSATTTNATDVGDLTVARQVTAGQQY